MAASMANVARNPFIWFGFLSSLFTPWTGFAGGLAPPVTYPTSGSGAPTGVVVADFDADGVLEVVVAQVAPDQIEIFENNGAGILTSIGTVPAPPGASSGGGATGGQAAVADVNVDGRPDVLVAFAGASGPGGDVVALFRNTTPVGGPISFVADAAYATSNVDPFRIAVGDFNNDGLPDLAVSNVFIPAGAAPPDPNISILLNNGSPPYYGPPNTPFNLAYPGGGRIPCGVAVADLDGDANLDVVATGIDPDLTSPHGIAVFANDGTGSFTATLSSPHTPNAGFGFPWDCAIADFNGGSLDVAVLLFENPLIAGGNFLDVFVGNGMLGFTPIAGGAFGPGPISFNIRATICLMDYDANGTIDVVANVPGADIIAHWLSNGAGGFTYGTDPAPSANSFLISIACGDLDGDGDADVIVGDNDTTTPQPRIAFYRNTAIVPPPLAITTTCPLPGGTVGVVYVQPLSASGGYSPYSWSITAGALPPGLTLDPNGIISGVPTSPGTSTFTITVTDGTGTTASNPCSITISATGGGGAGGIATNTRGGRTGGSTNLCSFFAAPGAAPLWLAGIALIALLAAARARSIGR